MKLSLAPGSLQDRVEAIEIARSPIPTVPSHRVRPTQTIRSGAQWVIAALEDLGVETIFGYPGGAIMPIYDALPASRLRHILVRHEQGAAFAADAYARVSGKPGICFATSGPGATNLVTGIANAMLDSVPMICVTGNVSQGLMGTDAFQEVDILGMTLPIVKHSWIIRDGRDIPAIFEEAFWIASSGRPGPVLIDLPKDVQIDAVHQPRFWNGHGALANSATGADLPGQDRIGPDRIGLARAQVAIAQAKRPLFYLGGGIRIAGATAEIRDLLARTGIPSVATLQGLGSADLQDPNYLGMLGMHGLRAANEAVQACDLLIAVGARFDDRATGRLAEFAPNARIVHFDIDRAEIGKLREANVSVLGDLKDHVAALDPGPLQISDWVAQCRKSAKAHAFSYDAPGEGIYAPALLARLSQKAGENLVIACDVGQHQMWVAQHCRFAKPSAHLTSGGLGAMGYGLPAGLGAKLADRNACVVTVSGDGSFLMNVQELATARRYGIPIKIILLDNSCLGLVRQWQELFFEQNFSEVDLSDNPDFVAIAQAFGIESFSISQRSEVEGGLDRLLACEKACLMHVAIDPRENVWPLVPPGKANSEMMDADNAPDRPKIPLSGLKSTPSQPS